MTDKGFKALREFFRLESAGGLTLMMAAVLAMICANSLLGESYEALLHTKIGFHAGVMNLEKSLHHWINDGLMVLFFLLVGLEIKREMLEGELSSIRQSLLPVVAALGGVAVPALIYVALNQDSGALHGWAIPTATDIAFALGILSLFGKRVPISLKIFLTAVAVIDDLIAIVIIALFYTSDITFEALAIAALCLFVLAIFNKRQVVRSLPYILLGLVMWLAVLESGVHATLAGVALGFAIPHSKKDSLLKRWEHGLHPWVAFAVLPIFAFANAGVNFDGITFETLTSPIPLGIALGLFAGKQIGIFSAGWLLIRLGYAKLPEGANWVQFYATAALCGVGFTMSLFVGLLAFDSEAQHVATRLGVLVGSGLSGVVGYVLLARTLPKKG